MLDRGGSVRMPDSLGLLFLAYLLVILPLLAMRSAPRLKAMAAASDPQAPPPVTRTRAMSSTLLMLGFLFFLAWMTGREFGFQVFAMPSLGAREIAAGVAALAACVILRSLSRAMRRREELRRHPACGLAPRTSRAWLMAIGLAIAAG